MGRRRGFTLIEIMIVLAIVGMMAATLLPRMSFYFEPPLTVFQRGVEEAQGLALSGASVRFVLTPVRARRGQIVVEALLRQEPDKNSLRSFLGTAGPDEGVLAWTPVRLSHPPVGEGWRMEPETVYFFTDGSCTPARLSWAEPGTSERDASEFLLTVTGYCAAVEDR